MVINSKKSSQQPLFEKSKYFFRASAVSKRKQTTLSINSLHRLHFLSDPPLHQQMSHLRCSGGGGGGGAVRGGWCRHVDRSELFLVEGRLQPLGQISLVPLDIQTSLGQLGLQLGHLFFFYVSHMAKDDKSVVAVARVAQCSVGGCWCLL